MLKSVRQEHIVRLHEAYMFNGFVVLVFEKLYGENVVRSLSLKNRYNEHTVSVIIKQVIKLVPRRTHIVCCVTLLLLLFFSSPPFSSNRQHLSYGDCLEVRGEIIRTVLCCIVY